ncbi:hypothetical protein [Nannocystis pusilla]|uniref:Uncharacterized protein n=1 Tax=Nannocystis pusilla TaxID=889268 RepID=A0ABS7U0U4_9BACT|nr:hypothetical protein [Nannocystis pusilla]MBZ5713980.1 hypothetical protein [Nannocystis pusilla]
MTMDDVRRALAGLLGGLVLLACPGRPGDGETDGTSSSDTDPSPSSATDTGDTPTTSGTPTTSDTPTTDAPVPPEGAMPHEGPWEVVVDALPFPIADIHMLTVGGREFNENFANRGVVEVLFDHPEETITVEARKYVFGDAVDREMQFARLSLWPFVLHGDPTHHPDPADDCSVDTWKDGCAILARYDGKSQPARLGMDLRVHLPTGWRGQLLVHTEDNIAETAWPRRGDVTIDGLCGNGEMYLEAGRARVRLCRDLSPAPTCPPESAAACATWPDGSGSEAWSPECPCGTALYGQMLVHAIQPWAADIVIDVPDDAWLNVRAHNLEAMKPHDCLPQIDACVPDHCVLDDDDPFAPAAVFNHPSPAAPGFGGFNVTAIDGGCALIPFVEPGALWTPDQDPDEELRGLVHVCTDCL